MVLGGVEYEILCSPGTRPRSLSASLPASAATAEWPLSAGITEVLSRRPPPWPDNASRCSTAATTQRPSFVGADSEPRWRWLMRPEFQWPISISSSMTLACPCVFHQR